MMLFTEISHHHFYRITNEVLLANEVGVAIEELKSIDEFARVGLNGDVQHERLFDVHYHSSSNVL